MNNSKILLLVVRKATTRATCFMIFFLYYKSFTVIHAISQLQRNHRYTILYKVYAPTSYQNRKVTKKKYTLREATRTRTIETKNLRKMKPKFYLI